MASEKSEEIPKIGNGSPQKSIQTGDMEGSKPNQSFESLMKDEPATSQTSPEKVQTTPLDLPKDGKMLGTEPSMDTLAGQMKSTSSILGDMQKQLHTKGLTLTQSQKYLLRNKLTNANENVRKSAKNTGVDVGPRAPASKRQSPLDKFVGLLTDSQDQLQKSQKMISNLSTQGKSISPTKLILIQIQLAHAQQSLEFGSVLLSKAVDSVKNLMQTQI